MKTFLLALLTGAAVAGYTLVPVAADVPAPSLADPQRLVVHEWGTFTSFSGSDGVPVGFEPNNVDLPSFVYYPEDDVGKGGRLRHGGLVSMETPVLYFYTDRETRVAVNVDFPKGWITEWYPFAAKAPVSTDRNDNTGGQSIRWNVKLVPNDPVRLPSEKAENHYYAARETDAVPLQVEAAIPEHREPQLRGGTIVQSEKFLFYRGVGTFPPPVTAKALGGGKVRITNSAGGRVAGLVLVTVRGGKVGFQTLADLDSRAEATATIPEASGNVTELKDVVVKGLTAAGLYEREARAMVATWDDAWFKEEGTRLLYLVPRAKTDELLPLKVEPKPTEVVRVLVGRHDFLTPEQEATAERQLERVRAAEAELRAASQELQKLGRFSQQAQQMAAKRLDAKAAAQK